MMTSDRLVDMSERWFRLLQRLYPPDFRDDMGDAVVETYRDRARDALHRGGIMRLATVWMRALADSVRNGPGERARPAVSWRRSGNWGRDAELAVRRLLRAPAFAVVTIGTLTIGLGMVAVVYTVVDKVLIAPMPCGTPTICFASGVTTARSPIRSGASSADRISRSCGNRVPSSRTSRRFSRSGAGSSRCARAASRARSP